MGKRKRTKRIIGFAILIIILIALFSVSILFPKREESAFPNDISLFRERFILFRDFDILKLSGQITLPEGTNLEDIKKVEFSLKGCSSSTDVFFPTKKAGSLNTRDCGFLTFPDRGGEPAFIHYDNPKLPLSVDGLESQTFSYQFKDNPEFLNKIIERKIVIEEEVDCTRSSQCPSIEINKKDIQAICNIRHKCSINLEEKEVNEPEEKVEKKTKLNFIPFLFVLGGLIVGLGVYFIFVRKKR